MFDILASHVHADQSFLGVDFPLELEHFLAVLFVDDNVE